MGAEKIHDLILAAIANTYRYQKDHAKSLLRNRTAGSRLVGKWATADVTDQRKLFVREGLFEYIPDSPGIGVRYFEAPLYSDEGVVGALPLRTMLERDLEFYANRDTEYGWQFIASSLGPLPPADCLRIVVGPASLQEDPDATIPRIIWHWYPHSRAILDQTPIDAGMPIISYTDLILCARKNFERAYVKLGRTTPGMQKIWPSVFRAQMSETKKDQSGDETQEIIGFSDENPGQPSPIIVTDSAKDLEVGDIERLQKITQEDLRDPPEASPPTTEERDLRLE